MDGNRWILLLDDGELDDVRAVLDELGIDFEQWNKSDLTASPPHPQHLLVTTATHAISAGLRRATTRTPDRAIWIAVATGDSKSQRSAILGAGFDYLVKRPTHPETFRSLLRGTLYRGNEQRLKRRVAVGYTISFRVNRRGPANSALLMDLSPSGCRLLTRRTLEPGTELNLSFPAELTGAKSFSHLGTVVRAGHGSAAGGEADESSIGVRFLPFDAKSRQPMLDLLNALASGPAVMPEASAAPTSAPASSPASAPPALSRAPRGIYDEEVAIFGLDDCVLIGRDLSSRGLRVDPHPALMVGAILRLALTGASHAEQILVDARVIRDDGDNGVALHFDWVEPTSEESLRLLIEELPSIEALTADPKQSSGIVLTSLISKVLRRHQL
ncbi:MAG: PilZ domain-containing protein [Deltaproteobacteria bacterium]|nr:PilZ domain-containing protein [Deltaproteobacteria bacterium]MBW2402018.1 PilZ domain-containing protein [Deltaproteobacteria bacterium]